MSFPESAIGAFADIGGELITLEWVPDPEVIAQAMFRVAGYLDNLEPPLRASQRIAMNDMEKRFDTESDPDGNPWEPLDPDYAEKKASMGGPDTILTWTRALRRAASSRSAFPVHGSELFFDSSGLPDYGLYHQAGTGGGTYGPETNFAGHVGRHLDYRERRAFEGHTGKSHESLDIGRGNALPQRRFIGISADAEEQMFEVFDLWFAEGVSLFVSGTGIVQPRGAGGRFGPRLYPR